MLSVSDFESALDRDPRVLASIIKTGVLSETELTFAAEILGRSEETKVVQEALTPLLKHPSALVREGVIYGVTRHQNEEISEILLSLSENDISEIIRNAAKDALDER